MPEMLGETVYVNQYTIVILMFLMLQYICVLILLYLRLTGRFAYHSQSNCEAC